MCDVPSPDKACGRSHATLMDEVYRGQRFIYDVTRKYYLFGRDTAIDALALPPGARLVEVGCGTARNLICIARRYPEAKLFGLDASVEMLRTAERAVARAGLANNVVLAQGYAETLSPTAFGETALFDAVLFSYSLSMIPDWDAALEAAQRALGPGGRIHIVDFGDFAGLSRPLARALRGWLSRFHVTPRDELLGRLEHGLTPNACLRLLPGRYAFIASLSGFSPSHVVAARSHAASKRARLAGAPECPQDAAGTKACAFS